MEFYFSVNLYDKDGERYDEGVFIHVGDSTIIRFPDAKSVEDFAKGLLAAMPEIRENIERAN